MYLNEKMINILEKEAIWKKRRFELFILSNMIYLVLLILDGNSYETLYYSTIILFLIAILCFQDVHRRTILLFLLVYYGVSLLPGSSYRGAVSVTTLKLYTALIYLPCLSFLFLGKRKGMVDRTSLKPKPTFFVLYYIHLAIVYFSLAYVILEHGNIMFNQEERFGLDGWVGYLIRTTIYIPFLHFVFNKGKNTKYEIIKYYILPLFPAVFIGSRGTVLMVLIGLLILKIFRSQRQPKILSFFNKSKSNKTALLLLGVAGFLLIVGFFYIRRMNSSIYVSSEELLNLYFDDPNLLTYLFAPLHFALREQIGISNYIIENNLTGTLPYPMFFADLVTVLPGKQPAAGISLNVMMTNNDHAGLTPGILGGLYLDYGTMATFGVFAFVIMLTYLYKKALSNDIFLLFYALSVTQFFHMFHRGFLKPEYLISYLIIIFYLVLFKKFNENHPRSISVITAFERNKHS